MNFYDISPLGIITIDENGNVRYPQAIQRLMKEEVFKWRRGSAASYAMVSELVEQMGNYMRESVLEKKAGVKHLSMLNIRRRINESQGSFVIWQTWSGYILHPTLEWLIEAEEKNFSVTPPDENSETIAVLRAELEDIRKSLMQAIKERDEERARRRELETKQPSVIAAPVTPPVPPFSKLDKISYRKTMLANLALRCYNKATLRILTAIVKNEGALTFKGIVAQTETQKTKRELIDDLTAFVKHAPDIFGDRGIATFEIETTPTGETLFKITPRPQHASLHS
jgi:hypothetical protein